MRKLLSTICLAASLAGCKGGGGMNDNNPQLGPTTVNFTAFSAVQPGQTVNLQSGVSRTVNGTLSGGTVTSLGAIGIDTVSTRATLTYDSNKALAAVSAITPGGSISFSKAAGDTFTCTSGTCGLTNMAGTASMIVMEPISLPLGWNYQTFGVWDRMSSSTSFDAGVFSVGAATPGAAVPTTGTGNFSGIANGFFVNSSGTAFFTTANMTANTDFSARTITFSTANTQTVNLSTPTGAGTPNSSLNLNGTFTWTAGNNLFSGSLNTAGNAMTGTGNGRFYGPNAEELGGTYNLTGGGNSMLGSFGGKR